MEIKEKDNDRFIYEVEITETYQKTVTVIAKNEDEAYKNVKEMYQNGDIVLDAGCYIDNDFRVNEDSRATLQYDEETLFLEVGAYCDNNRLAILCYTQDGELYSDVTINLPEYPIAGNKTAFINGDLNTEFVDLLKNKEIIQSSYGMVPYNMGQYECVTFSLDKLKEYDSKGTNEYIDSFPKKEKNNDREER